MEGAAILKAVDERGNRERAAVIDLAVADAGVKLVHRSPVSRRLICHGCSSCMISMEPCRAAAPAL